MRIIGALLLLCFGGAFGGVEVLSEFMKHSSTVTPEEPTVMRAKRDLTLEDVKKTSKEAAATAKGWFTRARNFASPARNMVKEGSETLAEGIEAVSFEKGHSGQQSTVFSALVLGFAGYKIGGALGALTGVSIAYCGIFETAGLARSSVYIIMAVLDKDVRHRVIFTVMAVVSYSGKTSAEMVYPEDRKWIRPSPEGYGGEETLRRLALKCELEILQDQYEGKIVACVQEKWWQSEGWTKERLFTEKAYCRPLVRDWRDGNKEGFFTRGWTPEGGPTLERLTRADWCWSGFWFSVVVVYLIVLFLFLDKEYKLTTIALLSPILGLGGVTATRWKSGLVEVQKGEHIIISGATNAKFEVRDIVRVATMEELVTIPDTKSLERATEQKITHSCESGCHPKSEDACKKGEFCGEFDGYGGVDKACWFWNGGFDAPAGKCFVLWDVSYCGCIKMKNYLPTVTVLKLVDLDCIVTLVGGNGEKKIHSGGRLMQVAGLHGELSMKVECPNHPEYVLYKDGKIYSHDFAKTIVLSADSVPVYKHHRNGTKWIVDRSSLNAEMRSFDEFEVTGRWLGSPSTPTGGVSAQETPNGMIQTVDRPTSIAIRWSIDEKDDLFTSDQICKMCQVVAAVGDGYGHASMGKGYSAILKVHLKKPQRTCRKETTMCRVTITEWGDGAESSADATDKTARTIMMQPGTGYVHVRENVRVIISAGNVKQIRTGGHDKEDNYGHNYEKTSYGQGGGTDWFGGEWMPQVTSTLMRMIYIGIAGLAGYGAVVTPSPYARAGMVAVAAVCGLQVVKAHTTIEERAITIGVLWGLTMSESDIIIYLLGLYGLFLAYQNRKDRHPAAGQFMLVGILAATSLLVENAEIWNLIRFTTAVAWFIACTGASERFAKIGWKMEKFIDDAQDLANVKKVGKVTTA